jgi:Fe-S-cluster-containing dehydrogenase component
MKKWHMIIDVARCENCNNCFLACKDEHCGNDWPGYSVSQPLHGHRWMNILAKERGEFPSVDVAYLPRPCMHCDNAPCVGKGENNAVYKRDDGIVIIDPERAVGQKHLVRSCPYDSIWWNEEKNIPQKCSLCAHLLDDGWKTPRCVQACPTGALSIQHVEPGRLQLLRQQEDLRHLESSGHLTSPRVLYKNLYRYTHCFIAGSIATGKGNLEECLSGQRVSLCKDGEILDTMETDGFGEFKFDGLPARSGIYLIEIQNESPGRKTIEVNLDTSAYLGTIWI